MRNAGVFETEIGIAIWSSRTRGQKEKGRSSMRKPRLRASASATVNRLLASVAGFLPQQRSLSVLPGAESGTRSCIVKWEWMFCT